MEFRIDAAGIVFRQYMMKTYPILEKYNITIGEKYNYITINTLEELVQLSKDVGWELIVGDGYITIHDGCVE